MFVSASLVVVALATQSTASEGPSDGRSLMERGAELFLEGLQREMAPTLRDLSEFADQLAPSLRSFWVQMGPAISELADKVEDWSAYHPPEILPNGDIIIRKKQPKPEPPATEAEPEPGQTDI
jgi:hypothetical protein